MKYVSTRGAAEPVSAAQAIVDGLAPDGGLYVPQRFPQLGSLNHTVHHQAAKLNDYGQLVYNVISAFIPELDHKDLIESIAKAYRRFESPQVVPVTTLGRASYLELFHGPTFSFKDLALMLLPRLMQLSSQRVDTEEKFLILTATSGDTGKAAMEGFRDLPNTEVVVFYPTEGISWLQRKQMQTQEGSNVRAIGIRGDFDAAQQGVKQLLYHPAFLARVADKGYRLTSANSINIGRILPQICYYIWGYQQLVGQKVIKAAESVAVVVPTGNFGNILSAYYAQKMGLPIKILVCASNENRVLTDFFATGIYDARRQLRPTHSPAIDVLISNNLERYLYDHEPSLVPDSMSRLATEEIFEWPARPQGVWADMATEADSLAMIRHTFDRHHYLIDPHTAVARTVWEQYVAKTGFRGHAMIAATASPYKFAATELATLGHRVTDDEFTNVALLTRLADDRPHSLLLLADLPTLHDRVVDPSDMGAAVLDGLR